MEQKRTIWIVLAAGIFLMVVIGTAVIIHKKDSLKDTTAIVQNENGTVWMSPETAQAKRENLLEKAEPETAPVEELPVIESPNVTTAIAAPVEGTTQIENMTVIATGNTNVYTIGAEGPATIDLGSTNNEPVDVVPAVTAKNNKAEVAIRETNTVRRNVETNDVLIEKSYREEFPVVAKASSNKKTEVKKAEPVVAPKTAAVKPAPKAAAPKAEKVPDRFWVQAGSYGTKKNADEAKSILEQKKIQCDVFTHTDDSGKLYYRVRVGPYTTKGEAAYWKKQIDAIPLFAKNGSFVTNTSTAK
ncbi:MAG: SPOR domain-containing protein [Treponema sp.]|nr:SPOR domain-containing protein [Candidatus Treponema equi]